MDNYKNILHEYEDALVVRQKRIDDLYNEIKVVKKLKAKATLLEAQELKSQELIQYFSRISPLPKAVLSLIAAKSNDNFSVMKQNIDLVQTYALGREVTLDDVEKVVPKSLQDNIFALTDLIKLLHLASASYLLTLSLNAGLTDKKALFSLVA